MAVARAQAQRVSEEVSVPRKLFSALIGSKGANIQEMLSKHGDLVIRFADADSGQDSVLLQGSKEQVAAVKAEIAARVADLSKKQVWRAAGHTGDTGVGLHHSPGRGGGGGGRC